MVRKLAPWCTSDQGSARGLLERAIAAVASSQHGVITYQQLLSLGLGRGAIIYRVKMGRLHPLYHGVYAVGHLPVSPYARAIAAVLACGPGAALSHGSALTLWGVTKEWGAPVEVCAPSKHRHPGIRTHRSKTLTAADITEHYGIPVTTPGRTLYDNAPRLTDAALARAVNDLRLAGYLKPASLDEVLARHPRSRSANRLRTHTARPEQAPTRSGFEDLFLLFAERYHLPELEVNAHVAGHEVDIFFPEHRLAVELDSWEHHSERDQFERDRDRDADLAAVAVPTVRVTWERFSGQPAREADRLRRILDRRAAST
ncbi:MAG TPA: type IV toxin-antitoxin system AbiEi family antitoxin domain-containing protein [Solirubrobacteraceae bacterium]|nr:type IV toxin-antitoxin system AbiEi family antitoxin domain-containing protein [Solirubrobacteraceae bacterium]